MVDFRYSYKDYYLKKHGQEWTWSVLDKYFLSDLMESIEQLFDIERKINPEFHQKPNSKEQDDKEEKQTKEIIRDFLGEFLDGGNFTDEFLSNLGNDPFLIYYLADKSIEMYTRVDPKVIYFATNSLFAKEYETRFPILYPLVSMIDLGITNYYDVSGSLNISTN